MIFSVHILPKTLQKHLQKICACRHRKNSCKTTSLIGVNITRITTPSYINAYPKKYFLESFTKENKQKRNWKRRHLSLSFILYVYIGTICEAVVSILKAIIITWKHLKQWGWAKAQYDSNAHGTYSHVMHMQLENNNSYIIKFNSRSKQHDLVWPSWHHTPVSTLPASIPQY